MVDRGAIPHRWRAGEIVPVKKKASKPFTTINRRGVLLVPHIAKAYARVVRTSLADKFNDVALPGQLVRRAGMTQEFAAQSSRLFMRKVRRRGRAGAAFVFFTRLKELVSGPLTSHEDTHLVSVWDGTPQ